MWSESLDLDLLIDFGIRVFVWFVQEKEIKKKEVEQSLRCFHIDSDQIDSIPCARAVFVYL